MTRPIVQYDDISLPYAPPSTEIGPQGPPPTKKRKKNNNRNKKQQQVLQKESDTALEEPEGPDLTHEEIWDDTALVQAWDSAMEEYDRFHGPGQDWKTEPISKSPLWYNVPSKANSSALENGDTETPQREEEGDSTPLNFETFVPTHDPSLLSAPDRPKVNGVSMDEAFEQAMNAMYWTGYWTAIYHQRRNTILAGSTTALDENRGEEVEGEEGEEEEEEESSNDLVSTQR